MYEAFFNLTRTPFGRDIPCTALYNTPKGEELQARLAYAAKTRKFCVITGDVGVGKTTALRKFVSGLDPNHFRSVYI